MADKLLVVLANSNMEIPAEFQPPLLQATVAAAMGFEVEVLFTGPAGKLAIRGEAEKLVFKEEDNRTVLDHIREAKSAGVVFKVCTPTLKLWGENIIPEIDETVGGAYIITEAMDDSVVTFTY